MSERPLAILLHGYGADRLSWAFNRAGIEEIADVVVPDLPGHGSAIDSHSDGSLAALADFVVELIEAGGRRHCYLIGHSLGGGVALAAASRMPGRIAGLFLVAPVGLGEGVDADFLNRFPELADAAEAKHLLARLVANPRRITDLMVERVLDQLDSVAARQAMRDVAKGLVADVRAYHDAAGVVARSDIECKVVWGEDDAINPLDRDRLDRFGASAVVLNEAGHMPHMERPRVVTPMIVSLLAGGSDS